MKTENENQKLRVLYLEDSKMDIELVRNILEEAYDLDFTTVENKSSYVRALKESDKFDLILSDYNLPDFDARRALVIANKECSDVPFICVSGTIGEEKAVELLKHGAVDYIIKDRMARLVPSIDRALKEAEEQRSLERAQQALKQQNKELLKAKQKAEESDRLKSVFLSNMSHEVRTPLNGIMGFSELLVRTNDPEKKEKYVSTIQESCGQLLHIIDSIVDISIIEANQIQLHKSKVNLEKIFAYVYSLLQSDFQKRGIVFKKHDVPENLLHIYTDESKLVQILSNLITNGLKFTEHGFVEFGIDQKQNDSMLVFFVKDTGIGIPKEKQQVIFERFRQVDEGSTRNFGGAGLGLAISKSFVEKLGGKIWVDSTPNEGSTFYFSLSYE